MKFISAACAVIACASASHGALVISEIDLTSDKVEIVNTGSTSIDMTGYFFCNRFNGSPFYPAIITSLIDLANSDTTSLVVGAGQVITFQMTAGFIPDASGEVGLYSNNLGFGSAANMVDYVSWGADATRDSVAAAKGIWAAGTFVSVTGITAGQTIQLGQGLAGNSVSDYSLATSTIGFNQVPEPTVGLLAGLGLFALGRRRRRN